MDQGEGQRDGEAWQGLTVRTREGSAIGSVVGVFADGPLAGRLRVHGGFAPVGRPWAASDGTAVFAIPRRAVVCRQQDSLVLQATLAVARSKYLMHVLPWKAA